MLNKSPNSNIKIPFSPFKSRSLTFADTYADGFKQSRSNEIKNPFLMNGKTF